MKREEFTSAIKLARWEHCKGVRYWFNAIVSRFIKPRSADSCGGNDIYLVRLFQTGTAPGVEEFFR